ncbi:hypothetical protein BHE74_00006346 [Ensete ventricosum]|nr:hypothetical protein BHE74_00006346 [Ensete ventricosum]
MVDFDRCRSISGSISRGREKKNLESGVTVHPHDPSPASDFFSPRGEKERGDRSQPREGARRRGEPEFLPASRLVSPRRAIHRPQAISSPRVGRTNEVTGFDDEMRAVVAKNLEGRGIRLHPGTNLSELRNGENGVRVLTDHGDEITADVVLFATGRKLYQVGLNEQQALEQAKSDILVYTSSFNPMKNTISGRQEKTVMKLVVDSETDKVLGASMCGPDAPEIMQGLAVALKCGATKAQFDGTVGIHPSAAEEFVTMRSITRRVAAGAKPKANI